MPPEIFDATSIKKAIQEALETDVTIPSGHRAALVTLINEDKAEIALAYKVNNNWSVDLIGQHDWTGNNDLGLISKITW